MMNMDDNAGHKTITASFVRHEGRVEKSDLNGYGLMHGGRLLTICDEIGYLSARKHAECDCLTRSAHHIQFYSMLREKESFSVEARVLLTGTTSLWVECAVKQAGETAMSAVFVYIAVNRDFRPVAIPAIRAENREEEHAQQWMQWLRDRIVEDVKQKKAPTGRSGL